MSKKITILFIIFLFASCNRLPNSVGKFNEICVFLSIEDKKNVMPIISKYFDDFINTPVEENIFNINILNAENFFDYKFKRNIIIISLDDPIDNSGDVLYRKISKNTDNNKIMIINDLFAKNQEILLINSKDNIDLSNTLRINKNWIFNNINNHIDSYVYNNYCDAHLKNDIIVKTIKDNYNYEMFVDENYHVIKKNNNFLWIGRGYPYRWITFSVATINNSDDPWDVIENAIELNMPSIDIVDHYKTITKYSDFIIVRGLYEHVDSDTGGPFFTYIFDNKLDNEVNLVSGFVNNPGKEKYYLLKELESIINNLQKGDL